ncbi:MAG: type II secretion system F family protein [bacterium]
MSLFGPVQAPDLIYFTSQLATLYKSGVTIPSAISTLQSQTQNSVLTKTLELIKNDLASGDTLADAMAKFPKIFNKLYVNSVWAGEATGALDEVLLRLVELLKAQFKLRREVFLALRYPIILIVLILSIILLKFKMLFLLIVGLGIILIGVVFSFYAFTRSKKRRIYWDRFILKIPIIGPLIFRLTMFRFAWLFEIINRTGSELTNSLRLVAKAVGNDFISAQIEKIAQAILQGRKLADSIQEIKVFPPMVVQLLATGEQSGKLDEMLTRVTSYYEAELESTIKNFPGAVKVMVSFMFALLAFLFIQLVVPIC